MTMTSYFFTLGELPRMKDALFGPLRSVGSRCQSLPSLLKASPARTPLSAASNVALFPPVADWSPGVFMGH